MKDAIIGILCGLGVKLLDTYGVKVTPKEELLVNEVVQGCAALVELIISQAAEKRLARA